MKKCLSFTICIVVCLILSTCSVSTQITTLPDGTQLNADEIARIEALKPEGEAFLSALQAKIKAPVDGESGSIEQIQSQIYAFMQEKFGNDYQKYIFEETRTQSIDIAENDTEPRTWVTFYEDSFYMERVSLTANWFILPWGSFNAVDMTTWETRKGDTTIEYPAFVQRLDLYMADDETNKSKTAFNSSYLAIVGDSKVGFFPKYPLHLSQLAKVTDPKAGPSGSRTWVLNWW